MKIGGVAAIAIGIGLRLSFLNEPVGNDEVYSFFHYAILPFSQLIRDLSLANNHVFYTVWMHALAPLFGVSELTMRLPAFVAGAAILPLTFWTAWLLWKDMRIATFSALGAGVSQALIHFSVDGRGYTLQTALVLLSVPLTWGVPRGRVARVVRVAGMAVLCAATLWTIPSGVVYVAPWAAFMLWRARRREESVLDVASFLGLAALLTLLLYAPARFSAAQQWSMQAAASTGSRVAPFQTFQILLQTGHDAAQGVAPVWLLLGLAGVGLATTRDGVVRRFLLFAIVGYGAAALVAGNVWRWAGFYPRSYVPLYPFIYMAAATGAIRAADVLFAKGRAGRICVGLFATCWTLWGAVQIVEARTDPSVLFFPDREWSLEAGSLVSDLARRLQPGDHLWAGPIPLDAVTLFHVVRLCGFRGYYGFPRGDFSSVRRIYVVAPNPERAEEEVRRLRLPGRWSPLRPFRRQRSVGIWVIESSRPS